MDYVWKLLCWVLEFRKGIAIVLLDLWFVAQNCLVLLLWSAPIYG